jgi:hypothetical protein
MTTQRYFLEMEHVDGYRARTVIEVTCSADIDAAIESYGPDYGLSDLEYLPPEDE